VNAEWSFLFRKELNLYLIKFKIIKKELPHISKVIPNIFGILLKFYN